MNVEDFGDTPDVFDLDAWIEQSSRPRREVTIYRDWALLAEYDRLVAEGDGAGDDEAMGSHNVYDYAVSVISFLIKVGYFNKEYLEEL